MLRLSQVINGLGQETTILVSDHFLLSSVRPSVEQFCEKEALGLPAVRPLICC